VATANGIPYHLPVPTAGAHAQRKDRQLREALMTRWAVLAALGILAAGCAGTMTGGPAATAVLEPTKGSTAGGRVDFVQKGDQVIVTAQVSGLSPGGHGFHIHEKGDCSSGDGMSAGGHFNPTGMPHGSPSSSQHHGGDMPMLVADAYGNATLTAALDVVTIGSGSTSIVGRSVIVHKAPDDYTTQPTGNSGARVACGVIRAS
jgi:Cu-Zn family superoxide dismutase